MEVRERRAEAQFAAEYKILPNITQCARALVLRGLDRGRYSIWVPLGRRAGVPADRQNRRPRLKKG